MGVRFPTVATNTFIGPLPATNAETIVLQTPPLNIPFDFAQIFLMYTGSISGGTGTTSYQYRLRRGTALAGALVQAGAASIQAVVGGVTDCTRVYFDTPGAVGGQQYILTVQQIGATAAGVWQDGALLAFVL